jgi:hypothetical protein
LHGPGAAGSDFGSATAQRQGAGLDAIEKAIRNALDKGDAGDRAYRERVYRSAFAALERALSSREAVSAEAVEIRRRRLRQRIAEIESEFVPALETPGARERRPRSEPSLDPGERTAARVRRRPPRRRARRGLAFGFVAVLLVATLGIGAWWTLQVGILKTASERDTRVPNPPATLDDEDFSPGGAAAPGADSGREWIVVFSPQAASDVTVPGGTTAEIVEEDGASYLRIRADGESAVLFDLGQGTLERLAGGRAMFSIQARVPEGEPTRISVECDMAGLGDCGRKRFEVGRTFTELLFETDLPDRTPGAAGTIAVHPAIEGGGATIDIGEIRVSTVP